MKYRNPILTAALACLMACNSAPDGPALGYDGPPFPYNLEYPSSEAKLPKQLEEISGIAWLPDNSLACVQDEQGAIFGISPRTGQVMWEQRFGKDGDYEDLAIADGVAYVLRSDGTIFRIALRDDAGHPVKLETPLHDHHDTEGLCLDASGRKLLVACKDRAGIQRTIPKTRAVYAFDLHSERLAEDPPAYAISLERLSDLAGRKVEFAPSGVAIHPKTGHLYVISSVGKLLVVLNERQEILHLQSLDHGHFRQPEGICFAPDGTLFISNEGKGAKANVLSFAPSTY
jgi:uncharacterized protein YjiK